MTCTWFWWHLGGLTVEVGRGSCNVLVWPLTMRPLPQVDLWTSGSKILCMCTSGGLRTGNIGSGQFSTVMEEWGCMYLRPPVTGVLYPYPEGTGEVLKVLNRRLTHIFVSLLWCCIESRLEWSKNMTWKAFEEAIGRSDSGVAVEIERSNVIKICFGSKVIQIYE